MFAHSKYVIGYGSGEKLDIRELAYMGVLKARNIVRRKLFIYSQYIFKPHIDLSDWTKCKLSFPPMTKKVPTETYFVVFR